MKNQAEALKQALLARGERDVTNSGASKFTKFTRQYYGTRGPDGQLRPVKDTERGVHWFVSRRNGSLRVGRTSSASQKVKDEIKAILLAEGRTTKTVPAESK